MRALTGPLRSSYCRSRKHAQHHTQAFSFRKVAQTLVYPRNHETSYCSLHGYLQSYLLASLSGAHCLLTMDPGKRPAPEPPVQPPPQFPVPLQPPQQQQQQQPQQQQPVHVIQNPAPVVQIQSDPVPPVPVARVAPPPPLPPPPPPQQQQQVYQPPSPTFTPPPFNPGNIVDVDVPLNGHSSYHR